MAQERVHRKLSAIFSADVKGYSRLMGTDEVGTVQILRENQDILETEIKHFNGRVVDSPGDNMLAEFMSAVDAVECAVKLQKGFAEKNKTNDLNQNQMLFRIGLNLGDIIYENEKIYGDGVNIASRIEGLAQPGGICISNTIYDQVYSKLDLPYEYMGVHELKNIDKSIKVYKIQLDERPRINIDKEEIPVSGEKDTITIPEKPSIAVMPFTNMSNDPEQDWFVDGFSENIITALSKTSRMIVIAKNSTFAYKGKPVHALQVSRELGVRYVLEGGIQKALNRIRVLVQLIDTNSGDQIWADRFDRKLLDIFDIQDEIALKIAMALEIELTRGEQARLWEGRTNNLKAFEKHAQAVKAFSLQHNIPLADKLYEEAIELDPDYVEPYVSLGWLNLIQYRYCISPEPQKSLNRALELAEKAISINAYNDLPRALLAKINVTRHEYDKAIEEGTRAISLNPNGADSYAHFGCIRNYSGMPEKGISLLEKAFRLNPLPPLFYYTYVGIAFNILEKYESAIKYYNAGFTLSKNYFFGYLGVAESYSLLDRMSDAQAAADEVLKIQPNFNSEKHIEAQAYKNSSDRKRFLNALREAGLP
jgi:adenylate cyclase